MHLMRNSDRGAGGGSCGIRAGRIIGPMRVLLVSANREQLPSPVVPLGILYVASAVRDAHEVKLVDLCFADDPSRAVQDAVARFRPDVVGLGLRNLHDNTYGSSEPLLTYYEGVSAAIRGAAPDARLVIGGAAITLRPTSMLERLGASHAIVGEGERSFRMLLDKLARNEHVDQVLRAADETRLVATSQLVKREQLDDIALPARDLVDPRYFEVDGTDNFQTKRGCAFQCTYCDYPDLEGRKVRLRSPDAIADEMVSRSKSPDVTHGFIVDSVFNVPRSHALAICEALALRGSTLPWVCYVSPASLDEALVAAMARAGCIGAEIGTDAGSERVLGRLKKPFSLDQVRRLRAAFRRHEIADCHTFVLGAADETLDEAKATLAFVEELDPDVAVFVVFMEDREDHTIRRADRREELLELLAIEAPRRSGWVVPELGIRFGPKVTRLVRRERIRGPSWVHLAQRRRLARA